MVGFEYYGKSTENIIGTPLLLVNFDGLDSLGMNRNMNEGERTIYRPVTNEYGTIYDSLSFTYALIKADYTPYTMQEQVTVERWLSSPKKSSELKFTDCNGIQCSYFGYFQSTRWETGNGGFAILVFTFAVNGAYPFRYYEETIWYGVDGNDRGNVYIDCQSDELEEYVYPIIRASAVGSGSNSSFRIIQQTDNSGELNVTTNTNMTVVIDCRRCIAYTCYIDNDGKYVPISMLKFSELGWQDVGNVYWPRLIPGINQLYVEGNVVLSMSYYGVYKRIGGWLT